MATLEDQKLFIKYKELYRKSLQVQPTKEEIEEIFRLEVLLRPKIGEPIVDANGRPIFAKSGSKHGGKILPTEARLGFQIHYLTHFHEETQREQIIYV